MQVKDKQNTNINIEDKDVKRRDPFYKEKSIHYVHKNKKKIQQKRQTQKVRCLDFAVVVVGLV